MPGFLAEQFYKRENGWIRAAMKVAFEYQLPPLFVLDPTKPDPSEWTAKDKKLIIGYQLLQDETCESCGVPLWLGHTELSTVSFEVKQQTCYSCQTLEEHDRDKDGKGVTPYVVPTVESAEDSLPSRAEGLKHLPD